MTTENTPVKSFDSTHIKIAYLNKLTGEIQEKTYQQALDTDLSEMQVNNEVYVIFTNVRNTITSEQNELGEYVPNVIEASVSDIPVIVL